MDRSPPGSRNANHLRPRADTRRSGRRAPRFARCVAGSKLGYGRASGVARAVRNRARGVAGVRCSAARTHREPQGSSDSTEVPPGAAGFDTTQACPEGLPLFNQDQVSSLRCTRAFFVLINCALFLLAPQALKARGPPSPERAGPRRLWSRCPSLPRGSPVASAHCKAVHKGCSAFRRVPQ